MSAKASTWAQKHCGADSEVHACIALAYENGRWLLYLPEILKFALAQGELDSQPLTLMLEYLRQPTMPSWSGWARMEPRSLTGKSDSYFGW